MAELRLEVPAELREEIRKLSREIDFEALLFKSLKHCMEVELKRELLRKIASKSKLTEEEALKLGDELKEGIARRHGVL
ncbi:MAG: hypothetical protein EFT35_03400 [Methanophagales archaeon ANME-1-THS]|nr:MAG: hypothetical protein EFT35_03400 [Methanophagales archaeon ANME-1-THS]